MCSLFLFLSHGSGDLTHHSEEHVVASEWLLGGRNIQECLLHGERVQAKIHSDATALKSPPQ